MDELTIPEIDVLVLDERRRKGEKMTIVDVREPWEAELCRIADSRLVPLSVLPAHVAELPREGMLVLVCHHGLRSQRAAAWLQAHGFENAVNLTGGIDEWARRVEPGMPTY
jgi:rhodanese-related sulfurtransferase